MKTDCRYSGDTNAFVASELEVSMRYEFEAHLANCEECRGAVESTRLLVTRLRSVPRMEPSSDIARMALAQIREEAKLASFPARWQGLAAVAGLIAVFAAVLVVRDSGRRERGSPKLAAGTDATAVGIARAVDWFLRTQEEDGSWNAERWGGHKNYAPALTALSLLAIITDEASTPRHEEAIARAARWLLKQQNPDGTFGSPVQGAPYNHSIATFALLHAYEHSREVVPKAALDLAVAALDASQSPEGGWGHQYSALGDRSITQWHILALDFASALGWDSARPPVERGLDWLRMNASLPEGPTEPIDSTSAILARATNGSISHGDALDFQRIYFSAAALEYASDASAKMRLASIRRDILNHQITAGTDDGSWSPDDRWGRAGGRLYSTALASLSLRRR